MKGKSIVSFLAYVSVALIAIVLVVGKLLGWLVNENFLAILNLIAQIIAYVITAVFAFSFAKSKKKIGWMVAYIIFVVVIIVFTGFNFAAVIKG